MVVVVVVICMLDSSNGTAVVVARVEQYLLWRLGLVEAAVMFIAVSYNGQSLLIVGFVF